MNYEPNNYDKWEEIMQFLMEQRAKRDLEEATRAAEKEEFDESSRTLVRLLQKYKRRNSTDE